MANRILSNTESRTHAELLDSVEPWYFKTLLRQYHGNKSAVARASGLSRMTLQKKLTRHGL
ncbi:MAG: hypothetical protein JRJ45_00445 [Deltaproteobacteria bacterium]|nr:hypothetical protein [Deltaproteobacteria bacterium]